MGLASVSMKIVKLVKNILYVFWNHTLFTFVEMYDSNIYTLPQEW